MGTRVALHTAVTKTRQEPPSLNCFGGSCCIDMRFSEGCRQGLL